jgi:hypothetical protein
MLSNLSENINPIKITNPKVLSFYNSHPDIDINDSQLLFIDFLTKCELLMSGNKKVNHNDNEEQYCNNDDYDEEDILPEKKSNQNVKKPNVNLNQSYQGEEKLELILNKLNPTSKIVNNQDASITCDYIITNPNITTIIIENKILEQNVSEYVVNTFKKSCQLNSVNGILMSQNTGIVGKNDFEIEIIGSNVIVYVHKVNNEEYKINLAINILNKVHSQILLENLNGNNTISDTTLNQIKAEYQIFVNNKEELQTYVKNTHSAIMNKLENIKLCNTGEYLSTKFTQVDKPKLYKCNLCDFYTSNTLKGMAAHKRGCKKKYPMNNESELINLTKI